MIKNTMNKNHSELCSINSLFNMNFDSMCSIADIIAITVVNN